MQGNDNPSDSIWGVFVKAVVMEIFKEWQAKGSDKWMDCFKIQNHFINLIKLNLLCLCVSVCVSGCMCLICFTEKKAVQGPDQT